MMVGCDWCISILIVLAKSCSLSGPLSGPLLMVGRLIFEKFRLNFSRSLSSAVGCSLRDLLENNKEFCDEKVKGIDPEQ